jgi:15-cis-phytoene synthase
MTALEQQCMDLVRQFDRDRYLASLFAPDEKRKHLLALYAFNVEICRVPNLVSEPQIGEIRLQWWLDVLAAIDKGEPQDHPVAQALASAVTENALPITSLENLVKAHIFDLYADPMPSVNDLEGYLGETESALIQLGAVILAGASSVGAIAGLAGVAYGLAKLSGGGKSNLIPPGDVNLSAQTLKRLGEARSKQASIPATAMPAFLPVALSEPLVRSTGKLSAWRRQWILWRAARAGRF